MMGYPLAPVAAAAVNVGGNEWSRTHAHEGEILDPGLDLMPAAGAEVEVEAGAFPPGMTTPGVSITPMRVRERPVDEA